MILDIHMARKYTWLKDLSSMYYGREFSCVCGYTRELDLTFYIKNIAFMWVLKNNFVSTIVGDSDFS
jgi:hypothetical protein